MIEAPLQSNLSSAARRLALGLAALGLGLCACQGCRSTNGHENATSPGSPGSGASSGASGNVGPPTLRLYVVTDVAGALEPCGCTRDQLGGLDHLGAWMTKSKATVPAAVLASAGPLYFMDPKLDGEKADQDRAKALAMARVLHGLDLAAFAPGANDWVDGAPGLSKLINESGAVAIQPQPSTLTGVPSSLTAVRDVGGLKVGFVGWGQPETQAPADIEASVRHGVDEAKAQGANLLIALAAVGRGEAKRIADAVPELTAVVVGSVRSAGDSNTTAPPIERVGDVLILQTANHLQTAAVVDFYVREAVQPGHLIKLADATGEERARQRAEVLSSIDDLRASIAAWERDPRIAPKDLASRKDDLAHLEAKRDALEKATPPVSGSFYRYSMQEIREGLGGDPGIEAQLSTYYKAVNDQNRVAFASRVPVAPAAGQASYIGIEACTKCHAPARKVWEGTPHAHAYATLSSQFKELNLDCVSCHVTGYERPGGSTVTHVDKLQNVQCEVCHGPGSKHAASPAAPNLITARPDQGVCLGCHHPPHVEHFDVVAKMQEVLGPGHGMPEK